MKKPAAYGLALALLGATAITGTVHAQDATGPAFDRQTMMKQVGGAVRILSGMARGEAEYDPEAAVLGFRTIQAVAAGLPYLFPEGSETGDETEAAPAIWSDWDGFVAAANELETDAAAAVETGGGGLEAFQAAFMEVAGNCRTCHEAYRIKRE